MALLNEADAIYIGATPADKVYLGANLVWEPAPTGPSAPDYSLVLTYTPGTDRNDFTGAVGVRIGIGTTAIPITWIGARRHHVNQTGAHTVKLYEWFSQGIERTAIIDYTDVAVGAMAWTAISPITLAAGGYYALLMDVVAFDGQTWCNPGPVTMQSSIVNIYDSYWYSGLQTGGINQQFIGLDLGWNLPPLGPEQSAFTTQTPAYDSGYNSEMGGRFTFAVPGVVTGVRYWFVATSSTGARRISAWTSAGALIASTMGPAHDGSPGWKTVMFNLPVSVAAATEYLFSCNIPDGYPRTDGAAHPVTNGDVSMTATTFSGSGPNSFPNNNIGSYLFTDVIFRKQL